MHLVALHFWAALVQYSRTKANKSNDMSQSPTCSPASKFLDEKLTPWVANQPVVLLHLKLVHIPSASCTAWFFKNWSNASTICFKFQWLSLIESEQVLATQPQRNHGRSQQGEQRGSQLHPFGAQKWVADEQQKPMDRNEKNNITCPGILAPQSKPALGQIWKKKLQPSCFLCFWFLQLMTRRTQMSGMSWNVLVRSFLGAFGNRQRRPTRSCSKAHRPQRQPLGPDSWRMKNMKNLNLNSAKLIPCRDLAHLSGPFQAECLEEVCLSDEGSKPTQRCCCKSGI